MKTLIALLLFLAIIIAGTAVCGALKTVKDPLDYPIKNFYSTPSEDSNLILEIPIEVKLVDISGDGGWYKVKISYGVGPFVYTYVGWTRIPAWELQAQSLDYHLAEAK